MIIALLALALAMIVGGLFAALLGWDIVLVERGWTMVISGSISAASGAILLGLTAAIAKLGAIQAELARLQEHIEEEPAVEPHAEAGASLAALSGGVLEKAFGKTGDRERDEEPEAHAPLADEGRHEDIGPELEKPSDRSDADQPALPFPPRTSPEAPAFRDEADPDMRVPDFLLAERHREIDVEVRISDADHSLYASEPDARDRKSDEVRDAVLPPEPEPHEQETPADPEDASGDGAAPEEPRPDTVVGTYNSGDNKYLMFSDGSIEAQTPKGVFRFQSLDELKEFIASGGEGNSSAAT